MENEFKKVMSQQTDEELIKIVTLERSRYNPIAVEAAESEIENRHIDSSKFHEIREKEIIEKKEKEKVFEVKKQISRFWIYFGYIALLFTGGIWGIIAGYIYAYSKHKTENGNNFFIYNKSSREEGKAMLIIGGVLLGIHIIRKII